MNFNDIYTQFERMSRTAGLTDYLEYAQDWINMGHVQLCTMFEVPSLKITETVYSVANQATYCLPYPWHGRDVSITYGAVNTPEQKRGGVRLDPYSEDMLDLGYDRRGGNKGGVYLYDWAGIINADYYTDAAAVVTNRSAAITDVTAGFTAAMVGMWCRFDPFTDAAGVIQNPGDYGYKILARPAAGTLTLEEIYRGPSSIAAQPCTIRIRPKETQIIRLYGIPAEAGKAIDMKVFRKPRRLYNNEDVPEYPDMGNPAAFMAIALGLHHLQRTEMAMVWESKAVMLLQGLKRRRFSQDTLTPDLAMSHIAGRQTGLATLRRYGGMR